MAHIRSKGTIARIRNAIIRTKGTVGSQFQYWALYLALTCPTLAFAGDIEQVFRNLVNAFVGRLLPVLALGYLGKHIFAHIQGDQNARNETVRVVVGIACLLSISGVWNFISQQAR